MRQEEALEKSRREMIDQGAEPIPGMTYLRMIRADGIHIYEPFDGSYHLRSILDPLTHKPIESTV